ncbi:MAG: excinuclease ABC subunit UvrB [Synergistales bacterium]|nr:excinuclease ABC subunit UvrB [Synergistales bacterium]
MSKDIFVLKSEWPPAGDQPAALESLIEGIRCGQRFQTLLGVTGSGKTFTVAKVIEEVQRPTLVLAHNKTLAAQLYSEFKTFFPENSVNYFVSYYDYYQPEAYIPASDIYIEKDASINERIEKLRLATTKSLLERRDVIVVASVSCIYGLGKRKAYEEAVFSFSVRQNMDRGDFLRKLVENYYTRNDMVLEPGNFRARGDIVEIYPAYSDTALRVSFFDEEIERIQEIDPVSGKALLTKDRSSIFPAQHYVTSRDAIERALILIRDEMEEEVLSFRKQGKFLEGQRLEMRTRYDMEMLSEMGYCSGIENYSRYLDGREPGETPGTLMDFFPEDFLMIIDESHITLPQVRGMYNGDRARKMTLVNNGFRLSSCLDNRPLNWEEFRRFMKQVIFLSATPGDWEMEVSENVAEQIARPTGVIDPEVEVFPARDQVDDLISRLRELTSDNERALVTTLTKRSSEDLSQYLSELGFKVKYIHSELNTFERAELLRDLRKGDISVLVGVNLLREGLDLPEVSLVAILDADREGFLRSHRSLIQMMGRAARNTAGKVILYADDITDSIDKALEETKRRRELQMEFNRVHDISPVSVSKRVVSLFPEELIAEERVGRVAVHNEAVEFPVPVLEEMMWKAVEKLDFETAARIRDILADKNRGDGRVGSLHKDRRSKRTQSEKHHRRNTQK